MLDDFTKTNCPIFSFSKYSFDQQDVCIASIYDFDYTLVQRPLVKEFITINILWIDKDWLISYSTFIFLIDWHSINLWCVLINMSGYLPWGWGLVRKHTVIAISTLFKGELNKVNINSEHLLNHLTCSRQCTSLLKECNQWIRDLDGTPKPDYDSDGVGVEVKIGVGVSYWKQNSKSNQGQSYNQLR